jgi:hypothetical protein
MLTHGGVRADGSTAFTFERFFVFRIEHDIFSTRPIPPHRTTFIRPPSKRNAAKTTLGDAGAPSCHGGRFPAPHFMVAEDVDMSGVSGCREPLGGDGGGVYGASLFTCLHPISPIHSLVGRATLLRSRGSASSAGASLSLCVLDGSVF